MTGTKLKVKHRDTGETFDARLMAIPCDVYDEDAPDGYLQAAAGCVLIFDDDASDGEEDRTVRAVYQPHELADFAARYEITRVIC